MLVITRHAVASVPDLGTSGIEKTGVRVGRKDVQVISVNAGKCIFNIDGIYCIAESGETITIKRLTISIIRIYQDRVRFGIDTPKNIKIDRWDRKA